MARPAAVAACLAVLLGAAAWISWPLLACPEACLVDTVAMYGNETGNFALPDVRLNAWILGWVQHALVHEPRHLFDANAFFPAPNTLAGSEHMLGNAILLLPARLFTDSAIALHQLAIAASFALIGATTFAFVRWAGRSTFAALLAGLAAMAMPWRYSEVAHVQLLSAQWLPLVWLFAARLLLGEGGRRDAIALAAALAMQMLTSFYLAYFALYSTACLAAGVAWSARPPMRAWGRLAAAVAAPSAVVVALALPYLDRYTGYRFANPDGIPPSTPPEIALAFLAPSPTLTADVARLSADATYYVPMVLFALALVPLARRWSPLRPADPVDRRLRAVGPGLACAMIGAFVLMLGRRLAVGDVDVPILGTLLASWVPGFSQMRAEFRWGLVIGVAFPILAGLGVSLIDSALRARRGARLTVGAAIALALWINTPLFQIPAKPAWRDDDGIETAHRLLATLEPGPVLELPWGFRSIHIASFGSRYMLASSFHWYPLLNGYTAYPPETHFFLQRIAHSLPRTAALHRLQQLTGLRWIALHPQSLMAWELEPWEIAVRRRTLVRVHADPTLQLYRVPDRDDAGSLRAALASSEPRERTLLGLSRAPLDADGATGALRVEVPALLQYEQGAGRKTAVPVEIANRSDADWPGFDPQPEGLVALRSRFRDAGGRRIHTDIAALDVDVPAGVRRRALAIVRGPALEGHYTVSFDLVQRIGDAMRPLAVPPVSGEVDVEMWRPPSSKIRDAMRRRSADPTRTGRGSETPE